MRSSCRALAVACLAALPAAAQAVPAGFEEAFALAPDRERVLEQLLPGSLERSYFRCLHLQHVGALDEAAAELEAWIGRHGRGELVERIENRQALLAVERDPDASYALLTQRLGLRFDHRRDVAGEPPDLSTRLDPRLIARETLLAEALARRPGTLDGLTNDGLRHLDAEALSPELASRLLARLQRPDRPDLAALVVQDLRRREDFRFGSLPIHGRLLLGQLEECARLEPRLLDDPAFVDVWVRRLRPGSDVDWPQDDAALGAYLDRLEAFVMPLAPVHNSLKAHVLRHRLAFDRAQGEHDEARLMAYLRLPRYAGLRDPGWAGGHPVRERVDVTQAYPTGLPPVGDDEPLVRELLIEAFRDAPGDEAFAPMLRVEALGALFAESKLLHGGEPVDSALLGGAEEAEAFRSRVELRFAPTNRRDFGPRDDVALDVDLKRVDALLVRVFEIDAFNVYTRTGEEIDADLPLDGLVANEETLHRFDESPLRRVRRRLELPSLARPGVYVVELVAGGQASRAVIRKGRLRHVERSGAAGHVFSVLDEDGRVLPDAALWAEGRLYEAGERGEVLVPFTTRPGKRSAVLVHGGRATLASFFHREERYALEAGLHVDREALLAGRTATLLLRPALRLNGREASLSLLEDPLLTVVALDHDGVASTRQFRGPSLSSSAETALPIEVPERLASLTATLSGRVASLSRGEDVALAAAPVVFHVNAIARTAEVGSALLGRTPDGYVLDLLGRSGEPLAGRALALELRHRGFKDGVRVDLGTDERGRVRLGALDGIESLHVDGYGGDFDTWPLEPDLRDVPSRLHGAAGETLRIAAPAGMARLDVRSVSLHELRAGEAAVDRFGHLALAGDFLELRGLPAGSYELLLADSYTVVAVELTAGERTAGWIVGRDRALPVERPPPQVVALEASGAELVVRVAGAGPGTRVHVTAGRYLPPFGLFDSLRLPPPAREPPSAWDRATSGYHEGRAISAEQRYVLDRRHARKFPGNMLARPTLLLNPWALDETGVGGGGGGPGGKIGRRGASGGSAHGVIQPPTRDFGRHPGLYPEFELLPEPSVTLANLRPGPDGTVRLPLAALGGGHLVQALAVDEAGTGLAELVLPETPLAPRDRALALAGDPATHLSVQRRIEQLAAGATAVVGDAGTARVALIDSLASVHRLFTALTGDPALESFEFLLRWPELSRDERLALLSEHGCHELHLFVRERDPQLFEEVLAPHLREKLRKTFLDRWLLEEDLSAYAQPWEFGRLNVVERILLGRRLPELAPAVARQLAETLALRAPDPAAERRRFDAALGAAGLGSVAAASPPARTPAGPAATAVSSQEESTAEDEAEEAGDPFLRRDAELRGAEAALFRGPGRTRKLAEHNYRHRRIGEQDGGLIPVNGFWLDFAQAPEGAPFVSTRVAEAAGSANEMLLALALLDLPFATGGGERAVDGGRLIVRAAGPLLLVSEQLATTGAAVEASPLVLGEELFRLGASARDPGEPALDELLAGEVYGSRVVVTNPTSAPQALQVLVQVPQGAVAVGGGRTVEGLDLRLGPYATVTRESLFYFPRAGEFADYPAQLTRDGALVAAGEPAVRHVVEPPGTPDAASWEHVSQHADAAELFDFLERANLRAVALERMAWRLRDEAFFREAIAWLGRRQAYSRVVWSYGLLHRDAPAVRELLKHEAAFVARCGPALRSPLLAIDPVERRVYEHIELEPLVNPRAHPFDGERVLRHAGLAAQYGRLMSVLGHLPGLDDADWMSVTYYLLLQDRVEEALAAFERVDARRLPGRLHHDLLRAHLAVFEADAPAARAIAEAHREHPIPRWRSRFAEILGQLDEAQGVAAAPDAAASPARAERVLELALDGERIVVRHAGLASCELSFFPMDVELLFSRDPFGQHDMEAFATIRPVRSAVLALDAAGGETVAELPAELREASLLVELRSGGLARRLPRYAGALDLRFLEGSGQLSLLREGSGEPLPAAYVKVFARRPGGAVRFHKDGYTDLRGRFDYASLSGEDVAAIERFAVLVLSEAEGAAIREVAPPTR